MNKLFIILLLSIFFNALLFQNNTKCQGNDCLSKLEAWTISYEKIVSIDSGECHIEEVSIEISNSRVCGSVNATGKGGWFNFVVFDELSYYKWRLNEDVDPLAFMENVVSLAFFYIKVEKPGKYYILLVNKSNSIKEMELLFTADPNIPFDEGKMFILPENGFVADMCESHSGHMEFIVSKDEPVKFGSYIKAPSKIITLTADVNPINLLVKDEEGVTMVAFQGLEGTHKIDIKKEKAMIEVSTSSSNFAYVTVEPY